MQHHPNGDAEARLAVRILVPPRTLFAIVATLLLVYATIRLAPLLMTLFIAMMLAVSLYPLYQRLLRARLPRWAATAILAAGLAGCIALFALAVLPQLSAQAGSLVQGLPALKKDIVANLPGNAEMRQFLETSIERFQLPEASALAEPLVLAGRYAFEGLAQFGLMLVFAVYLVVDGAAALKWFFAFFSHERRVKLEATSAEMAKLISAYVSGQCITSLLCGAFSFAALKALHVPAALTLAVLAAVFDVLPVLGFFIAALPAVAIAFTVSKVTALSVLLLYVAYHLVENYLLVPKIYGNRLRLSDLTVMLALIAAGSLTGLLGAIAVLPLVASYPIIERIWLGDLLGGEVVRKHQNSL